MNSTSRSHFSLTVFAFTTLIGCTDDVTSGDEVVDDSTDTSATTGETDEDSGSTSTTSESGDGDTADTLETTTSDVGSESESTTDGESTTEESTTEGESTTEESTTEESTTEGETGGNLDCGDGVMQITEACDDGNDIDGDGCESDCTLSVTADWVVVRDSQNQTSCSSIYRMEFRPDGDLATVGESMISWSDRVPFVATWADTDGQIMADYTGDLLMTGFAEPNLDPLANGDLLVSYATEPEMGFTSIGTVSRFGSDLTVQFITQADQFESDPPLGYDAVLGIAGDGMLALSTGTYERVYELDAQGHFVQEVTTYGYFQEFDMARIADDEMWELGRDFDFNLDMYVGVIRRYGIADLQLIGPETEWVISSQDFQHWPVELEHRGGHTVALGPVPNLDDPDNYIGFAGLWRFDADGELIASHTIEQFGNVRVEGLAIAGDGTLVVAAREVAFGVGLDGELLWHVTSAEIEPDTKFYDALVDDEGKVYLGGQKFVDFDCYAAVLARISL